MTVRESIQGVVVKPLKRVVNERGWLLEMQRQDDPEFKGFGQTYATATLPGIVKAWYRHHRQIDNLAVASGQLRIALYDDRPASPTKGAVMELLSGGDTPLLVQIPVGVWHGFTPVGGEAIALHLNTLSFDFAATDEDRLPPDTPLIPFRW